MLNFRDELSKIKKRKLNNEVYNSDDIFQRVIIPYFENVSIEEFEKGVELFVHYHSDYLLIGIDNKLLFRENSANMSSNRKIVKEMKDKLITEGFKIYEEYHDGFCAIIKA